MVRLMIVREADVLKGRCNATNTCMYRQIQAHSPVLSRVRSFTCTCRIIRVRLHYQ